MNRRAIGYGVLGGVAVVALQYAIAFLAPLDEHPELVPWVVHANRILSIVAYAVAGAIAGHRARERGALHGLLAGLGTAILGRLFGTGLAVIRYGPAALEAVWSTAGVILGWVVASLLIATAAGALAERVALRRPRAP